MTLFDVAKLTADRANPGELHLHESSYSCTSLFTFPNAKNLKGIAPHIHDYCDDIEVLLNGEIAVPATAYTARIVPAPHLIINRQGAAHGFFAHSAIVVVVGIRTPKSYQGRSLLSTWQQECVERLGPPPTVDFIDLRGECNVEYTTDNTLVRVHHISNQVVFDSLPWPERVLISLAAIELRAENWAVNRRVPKHALVILPGEVAITCIARGGATVVELIPGLGCRSASSAHEHSQPSSRNRVDV